MNKPQISVYIASHNYGRYLAEAIESVLRQTADNWELLVVDDNSTDNTQDVMKLYQGDPRVRLFSTKGIGLPAVCNLALRESRGKYIIRLDGDDFFDENILLVLGIYMEQHTECAMVFPDYYLVDEDGEIFSHERREKLYVNNHMLDIPANGACSLIHKEIIEKIGGYREDLGAQDGYDLWNKLLNIYKVGNINLPLFYYRRHASNLTTKTKHILFAKRQIKLDNIISKLDNYRPIIAVIPCRRNYDFSLNLWERKIKGRSLLYRSIEKTVRSELFDHIVVTSDNDKVRDVISLFDDPRLRFYKREMRDTIRSVSIATTVEKLVQSLDEKWNGLSVLSYLQSPFVTTETLEESICTLVLNDADCAFGVEEIKHHLYRKTAHGLQAINPSKAVSSDFDVVYRESNTSLATKNCNLRVGSLTGPSVVNFLVSSEESFFVNSEQTLKIANTMEENQ